MKQGHHFIIALLVGFAIGYVMNNQFLKGQLDVAKAVCTNVNIANWVDAEEVGK